MKPGGRNKRSLDDAKGDQKSKKQTTIVTKTVLEAIEAGETPGIKQERYGSHRLFRHPSRLVSRQNSFSHTSSICGNSRSLWPIPVFQPANIVVLYVGRLLEIPSNSTTSVSVLLCPRNPLPHPQLAETCLLALRRS